MRTRLSVQQRRAQLLAIGAELFARRPYEDVSIEEVADVAQVSCGLLYHYFPNKRAYFRAIVEHESTKLLHGTTPDPSLPPLEQLKAGLEVYIDYAERHPDSFRMAQQAAVPGNDLHSIHQALASVNRDRILTGLSTLMTVDKETQIAVTAWFAFVSFAILDWLDNPAITREQLRDLCARTLWAPISPQLGADATSRQ
jgi:AcrR family transcriptional regulator